MYDAPTNRAALSEVCSMLKRQREELLADADADVDEEERAARLVAVSEANLCVAKMLPVQLKRVSAARAAVADARAAFEAADAALSDEVAALAELRETLSS